MSSRPEDRLARRGGAVELLRVPAALFGALGRLRGALYDRRWLPIERADAAVVSVGNLTAGGTGKTPMVAWLARELARRGRRPGIASRGYGARAADQPNDEALQLAAELPDVPHVQDPDRARGARALVERGVDVVLLDDGFQHRRLHRDLDLVLVDATRPWGLPPPRPDDEPVRALLPRGLLREGPAALARADAIVLTRSDLASTSSLVDLRGRLQDLAPGTPIAVSVHRPSALRAIGPEGSGETGPEPGEALAGRAVDLVSGIGNPESFEATVGALGAEVRTHRRFGDHHAYGSDDLRGLGADGAWVVTTAKDAVKLDPASLPAGIALHALEVRLELVSGEGVLAALLDALPESAAQVERRALHGGLAG